MARDVREWSIPGPPNLRYTKAEVVAMLGVHETTLDRLIAERQFPRGHKATPQSAPVWSGQVLACWFFLGPHLAEAAPAKGKGEGE